MAEKEEKNNLLEMEVANLTHQKEELALELQKMEKELDETKQEVANFNEKCGSMEKEKKDMEVKVNEFLKEMFSK